MSETVFGGAPANEQDFNGVQHSSSAPPQENQTPNPISFEGTQGYSQPISPTANLLPDVDQDSRTSDSTSNDPLDTTESTQHL